MPIGSSVAPARAWPSACSKRPSAASSPTKRAAPASRSGRHGCSPAPIRKRVGRGGGSERRQTAIADLRQGRHERRARCGSRAAPSPATRVCRTAAPAPSAGAELAQHEHRRPVRAQVPSSCRPAAHDWCGRNRAATNRRRLLARGARPAPPSRSPARSPAPAASLPALQVEQPVERRRGIGGIIVAPPQDRLAASLAPARAFLIDRAPAGHDPDDRIGTFPSAQMGLGHGYVFIPPCATRGEVARRRFRTSCDSALSATEGSWAAPELVPYDPSAPTGHLPGFAREERIACDNPTVLIGDRRPVMTAERLKRLATILSKRRRRAPSFLTALPTEHRLSG